jgi:hypothetical protein
VGESLLAAAELDAHRERLAEHLAGIDAAVSREQPKLEDAGMPSASEPESVSSSSTPLGKGPVTEVSLPRSAMARRRLYSGGRMREGGGGELKVTGSW